MRIAMLFTAAAAVTLLAAGSPLLAQHTGHAHGQDAHAAHGPKTVQVEGTLIDLGCYTMGMGGSDRHARCAVACAEKGVPVGLLTAQDGVVYTVVLPSPKLSPYVMKEVRVTGKVHGMGLLAPEKIEIRDGKAWKSIEVPSVM